MVVIANALTQQFTPSFFEHKWLDCGLRFPWPPTSRTFCVVFRASLLNCYAILLPWLTLRRTGPDHLLYLRYLPVVFGPMDFVYLKGSLVCFVCFFLFIGHMCSIMLHLSFNVILLSILYLCFSDPIWMSHKSLLDQSSSIWTAVFHRDDSHTSRDATWTHRARTMTDITSQHQPRKHPKDCQPEWDFSRV